MKFLTNLRGRSVGATVAAVALVGSLSVGMVAMDARPAEAILPVVPVVILGATAGAGGATISGAVGTLLASTAAVGIGMALTQPGAFDWLGNVGDFFGLNKDESGQPVDTVDEREYVPMPSTQGNADPLFDDYVWSTDNLSVVSVYDFIAGSGSPSVRARYRVSVGAGNMRGTAWVTMTCKNPNDAAVQETRSGIVQEGIVFGSFGPDYLESDMTVNCASVGMSSGWVPTMTTFQPPTTVQKATYQSGCCTQDSGYRWAPGVTTFKSADYAPKNPQYIAEVTCVSSSGVRTKLSMTTDITPAGTVNVPSCKAAGLGDVAEDLVVGFADGDKLRQPIFTATPVKDDAYLNCDPAFGQVCKFQIFVDGAACVVGSPACVSWAGLQRVNPSRVKCMYGTQEVDMSGCAILEGAYVPGGSPAVNSNIDGNPDTWTEPVKVPGFVPHIIPEPGADPVPDPNPNPNPQPNPNPNPNPDTPTNPQPETPPNPIPPTVPIPPGMEGANCWGAGSASFNPLEWVFTPVSCALQQAFIPKLDITARVGQLQGIAGSKAPISWMSPPMVGPGGAGCPNWVISVPGLSQNIVCESSFTGAILGARGPLFGLVAGAMIWPLFRSLWYAAIPVLRVTPSSSK